MQAVVTSFGRRCLAFSKTKAARPISSSDNWCRVLGIKQLLQSVRMSSSNGSTEDRKSHLELTENSSRNEGLSSATITDIKQTTPTIKSLILKLQSQQHNLTFKPGQWLDMYIPGVDIICGFSMVSSPRLLSSDGEVHLAVKYSQYPPTDWVHKKCKIGDVIRLQFGGDFYYNPTPEDLTEDILLIAGGVGINPMYSILNHLADIKPPASQININLLYSAKDDSELIFKDNIDEVCKKSTNITAQYFTTKSKSENQQVTYGRMTEKDIKKIVEKNKTKLKTFVCGPTAMIEDIKNTLLKLGLNINQIRFENWT